MMDQSPKKKMTPVGGIFRKSSKQQQQNVGQPGPSTSKDSERRSPELEQCVNFLSPEERENKTEQGGVANLNGEPSDRMEEEPYPFGIDLGPSERQSRLARQRLIEEVIQEQNQNQAFDQELLEELERANMQRVLADDRTDDGHNSQKAANAIHHEGIPLTLRAEAAIANYMVRKYSEPARLDRGSEHPSLEDSRAVNILPAGRNLELPVNSLVVFGRRPSSSGNLRNRRVANAMDNNPLGWQATKASLKERIEYMYCNDLMADVYFFVGKEEQRQRIPAHKFVLSIGSVVFDAMFNGGLTPQNSRDPLEIELPDVEPSAFETLLKFLYTDNVKLEPENVMATLYTAKKYAVPAMEKACVDFLKESLGANNAFMLLTQARLFDEPQLEQLCLELIDKNTHDALSGDGFTEIDVNTLCAVLARDTLRVREVLLFQSVIRWATEECVRKGMDTSAESKRQVLGSALQLIRFPLMTVEEFAQTAAQSGLLPDREIVDMFLYFTVNPKQPTTFNARPRCAMAGKELVICRFQRNEARWGYTGVPDRIKFSVDSPIYIMGFGLYGGIVGPQEYAVTIQILHCGTGNLIAENETSFVCDGSSSTFRVLFRDPVEITPSVTYIASALLKGPDSHYGTKGLRRIVHQSVAGSVAFQFTYAAGNNNGTSVEDGQIPEIIFYTKN